MKKVKVIFPDGSIAEINESELSSALSAGAKRHSDKSTSMVFKDGSVADIQENDMGSAISAGAVKKKVSEDGGIAGTSKAPSESYENKDKPFDISPKPKQDILSFMQVPVEENVEKLKSNIQEGRAVDPSMMEFVKAKAPDEYKKIETDLLPKRFRDDYKKETGQDYSLEGVKTLKASQRIKLGLAMPGDSEQAVTELVQDDLETNFPIKPKNILQPYSQTIEQQVSAYNEIMTNPEKKAEYLLKRQKQEIGKESKLTSFEDRFSTESMSLGDDMTDAALDNPSGMKSYAQQRGKKLGELNTLREKIDNLNKIAAVAITPVEMDRLIKEQGIDDINSQEAIDYLSSKNGREKLGFRVALKSDARLGAQLSDIEKSLQSTNDFATGISSQERIVIPTDEDSKIKSLSETGDEKIQAQLRMKGYNGMVNYYQQNGNTEAVNKLKDIQSDVAVENGAAYSDELWARLSNARFKDNGNKTTIGTFGVTPEYLRKLATQEGFTSVEMSMLEPMIKNEMSRSITSNLQTSGFVDNLFEAVGNTAVNMKNLFRGDAARTREILNDNTGRKEDVGQYSPFLQELKQISEKEKEGTLTIGEQSRKELLLSNTNLLNWWQQIKSGTGDLTGQVLGIAISAKGLDKIFKLGAMATASNTVTAAETAATAVGEYEAASAGIANNISNTPSFLQNVAKYAKDNRTLYVSSYTNAYDGYKKESLQLMPGVENEGKRLLYSNMMSGFEAVSETIFNDKKVLGALGNEIKPVVREIVHDIGNGSLDKAAAMGKLQNVLLGGDYKKFIGNFLTASNQNASEEVVVDFVGDLSKAIVLEQDYNLVNSASGAFKTYYTTLMNGALVSGMAAKTDTRNNTFNKSSLYNIASQPVEYKDEVNRLLLNGTINQQEANGKLAIINKAEQAYQAMVNDGVVDKTGKNDAKNAAYLLHVVNESVNKLKADQSTDEIAKADFEKQAERSKNIREAIYTGKVNVDEFLNVVTEDQKIAENLDIEQIAPAVAAETGATVESAVIEIGGKTYEGKNHAEAILSAQADGKDISQVDRKAEGKFKLSDGSIIDRAEAKSRFGQDRSELMIEQDEAANQANKDYAAIAPITGQPESISPPIELSVESKEVGSNSVVSDGDKKVNLIIRDIDFTSEGGNKVVDDNGEPITVYHTSKDENIKDFKTSGEIETLGGKVKNEGAYFTPNKGEYAHKGGKEYPVKISIKNPYITTDQIESAIISPEKKADLISKGHDGVILMRNGKSAEYIVFDKSQVKLPKSNESSPNSKEPIPEKVGSNSVLEQKNTETIIENPGKFRKKYIAIHKDVRGSESGKTEENKKSIKENGFRKAFNVNTYPHLEERDTKTKKGDVIYLIPKDGIVKMGNGEQVKTGWKPQNSEIVTIEYDGQSIHEAYLKQQKTESSSNSKEAIPDVTPTEPSNNADAPLVGKEEVTKLEKERDAKIKEGFTESKDLNKIFADLKAKYGDKKGNAIYDAANRLVNPNTNTIIEIRGNGVVVKEGGKYILKPFGNTDASSKKWTLYKGLDITDQFPTEKQSSIKNEEAKAIEGALKSENKDLPLQNKISQDANNIINQRSVFERFSPEEQLGIARGGKIHAEASIILAREGGTGSTSNQSIEEQENTIEQYAKQKGVWVDDINETFDKQYAGRIGSGEEAIVWDNGDTVVKSQNTLMYGNLQEKLDGITLMNAQFPEAAIEVIGFGRNEDGDFQVLVKQPFIKAHQTQKITKPQLDKYLAEIGYTYDNENNHSHSQTLIEDLHTGNAILTPEGNIVIIDPIMRLNTPEQGYGGTRKINENKISDTKTGSSDTAPTVSEAAPETESGTEKTKQQRIEDFNAKADKVANSLIDFLTPKSTRGATKSGMGIEEIVKGATAAIKKAYAISQNISDAVEAGIQYFKDNWNADELGDLPEQALRNKLINDLENEQAAEPKSKQTDNSEDDFLKAFDLRTSTKVSENASIETLKKMGYSPEMMDTKEKVEAMELDLRRDDAADIIQKAKDVWGDDIAVWGKKLYQKALGLVGLDKTIEAGNATGEKQLVTLVKLRKELNNAMNDFTNRINFSEDKVEQQAFKNERAKAQNIQRQVNEAVEKIGNNASRKLNLLRIEKSFDGVTLVHNIKNKITGEQISNDFDKVNEAIKEEIGVEEIERTVEEKDAEITEELNDDTKPKKRTVTAKAKKQAQKNKSSLDRIKAIAANIKKDLIDPITPCT